MPLQGEHFVHKKIHSFKISTNFSVKKVTSKFVIRLKTIEAKNLVIIEIFAVTSLN